MSTSTYRTLSAADSARIDCQGAYATKPRCTDKATVCETVEWNTGNTTGISFFYYCAHHEAAVKARPFVEVN